AVLYSLGCNDLLQALRHTDNRTHHRLVVLVRRDTGSRLVTWRAGTRAEVSLPGRDAYGLAIDNTGRAAVVAGGRIFVADNLTREGVRWSPVTEFQPNPGEIVLGLAWSPDGDLAWAGAKDDHSPISVVAGPVGGTPKRIEVDAWLDGLPVWLDTDRVAVLAIRDPAHFLAIVRTGTSQVTLEPFEALTLAVSSRLGLIAVGARDTGRVELRRLEDLTAARTPIAVITDANDAIVDALAFSTDGTRLAVTWRQSNSVRVALYDQSTGWQELARFGPAELGIEGPVSTIELAWRP
ncbi:MAG: hypothetical protein C4343_01370, partial [Chloroflexota bacterium]